MRAGPGHSPGAPWGSAAGEPEVYQLAVNESFLDRDGLTAANMPVAVGGIIYVPYTVFDKNKNTTGVDLGVSCLEYKDAESYTLTMFSLKGTLIFDINAQTCLANQEYVEMRAIVRNGKDFRRPPTGCASSLDFSTATVPPRRRGR